MATVYKMKNGKWRAEVRMQGVYKSKTFDNKRDAKNWSTITEVKISDDKYIANGIYFKDLAKEYLIERTAFKKSKASEERRIKLYIKIFGEQDISSMTSKVMDKWLQSRVATRKTSTALKDKASFSSIFKYAVEHNYLKENPIPKTKHIKAGEARYRNISNSEIQTITEQLEYLGGEPFKNKQTIAWAFLFAIETAMRQGEIFKLDWDDIHLERRYCLLRDTKNGKDRAVPLSKKALELLNVFKVKKGKLLDFNQDNCAQTFKRVVKSTKIENLTFHDSRHEAITRLADKLHVLELARIVGHSDTKMLMVYYNPRVEELADKLD